MSLNFCCNFWIRIWHIWHGGGDPPRLGSTVPAAAAGVMEWEIFSWHTLGLLVPTEHHLNAKVYLGIVADHDHSVPTMGQSSNLLKLVHWTWQSYVQPTNLQQVCDAFMSTLTWGMFPAPCSIYEIRIHRYVSFRTNLMPYHCGLICFTYSSLKQHIQYIMHKQNKSKSSTPNWGWMEEDRKKTMNSDDDKNWRGHYPQINFTCFSFYL